MFNLLMFNVDWKSSRVTIPLGRVLEYTHNEISSQFKSKSGEILLDGLLSLPCIFCEEGIEDEVAYVGQISRARMSRSNIALDVSFDPEIPPLQNSLLYANRSTLEMPNDFEFSRNHWAVKDVDLYRFLLRTVRPRRQQPTVFQIPEHENIDPALVSAMMPFNSGFKAVYRSIREAAEEAGMQCMRADDIWENASIIQDVVSLIDRSRIVVCDCSGRNSNVFYEAGIAHTLGRDVVLITQSENDIPFDLRHLRYIPYLNNREGRVAMKKELLARMQTLLGHQRGGVTSGPETRIDSRT